MGVYRCWWNVHAVTCLLMTFRGVEHRAIAASVDAVTKWQAILPTARFNAV
jgi:hypothetical protein